MKVWLALLALTSGCGRIGFDARDAGVAGADDGGDQDADRQPLRCPTAYFSAGGGCYRLVADVGERTWLDAEADCESDAPGAHLVVIDDAEEASRLHDLTVGGAFDHFIGASDRVTEGTYLTVTNMPLPHAAWSQGEPNGGPEENCVSIENQQLKDDDCDASGDYLCEYDEIPADPSAWSP